MFTVCDDCWDKKHPDATREPQTESSALPAALERSLDLYFANGWSRDWQREHDRLMLQEVDRRISAAYTDLRECNAKVIYAMEQRILAKVAIAAYLAGYRAALEWVLEMANEEEAMAEFDPLDGCVPVIAVSDLRYRIHKELGE